MERLKRRFCIGDLAVTLAVLLLAAVLVVAPSLRASATAVSGGVAVIRTPDSEERYPLDRDLVLELSSCGISLTVKIENGEVFVEHSDCPDGSCVRSGRISDGTRAVVCVPARLSVTVESSSEVADADFIIG